MNLKHAVMVVAAIALVLVAFPPAGAAPRDTNTLTLTFGDGVYAGATDHRQDCTALAVVAVDIPPCLPTAHVRDGIGFITLGFPSVTPPGPVPLTGTIKALLTHDGGQVDFRCSWNNNVFQGCQIFALSFPPFGADFEFSCSTQVGGAQPVAIGNWACFVDHF
jgi:hypothetical protein